MHIIQPYNIPYTVYNSEKLPLRGLGGSNPIPLRRLNTTLVILQPEIPKVIFEAQSYIACFLDGRKGIVLIEVSGYQPGIGCKEYVFHI